MKLYRRAGDRDALFVAHTRIHTPTGTYEAADLAPDAVIDGEWFVASDESDALTKLEAAGKIDAEFDDRRKRAALRERLEAAINDDEDLIEEVMTRETVRSR